MSFKKKYLLEEIEEKFILKHDYRSESAETQKKRTREKGAHAAASGD